eukprot:CAMPEP_0202406140 /NCGR_PEP_ID=MMETSP1128-20130828/8224_1 /ASSEMBLY_ACC=CAM_ASM_000463 /TAXON_ID=3047 /ORGANISM="Dunaliella tertiolecta, Strain CCMP1320" /LENGTH=146 /DNA_ID=CAMNT_0049010905 /DNA_START=141 /DNA_END=577 /DNA_ORIENTATION=-
MSTKQNSKYANSNLNSVLQKSSTQVGHGAAGAFGGAKMGYHGMLVLSKKPRVGSKLSVPLPVNLPSIKKEHAGNDPNTQLVPAAGSGSWQSAKPAAAGDEAAQQQQQQQQAQQQQQQAHPHSALADPPTAGAALGSTSSWASPKPS